MPRPHVHWTLHAFQAAKSRDIDPAEANAVLRDYEVRRESPTHHGQPTPHTFIYTRGSISVVVTEPPGADYLFVKTVLLATEEQWTDEDARARPRT